MRSVMVIGAIAVLLGPPALSQPSPHIRGPRVQLLESEAALQGLDALITKTLGDWQVPGVAVSIVKDGKIVLSKGYGVRDPVTRAPMTKDTLFPIASMAKTFTSFTAGLLAEEGKVDLDQPIRNYVPFFGFRDAIGTTEISLRDLLSHRSGFRDVDFLGFFNPEMTRVELVGRLAHFDLASPIRTQFEYSNFGYAAAGHAIETVADVSWERYVQERVLKPLGMSRSTTRRKDPAEKDPNHIRGVVWWKGRYVPTELQIMPKWATPAGGIYSTAEDLTKWMLVHLSGGKLGDKQIIRSETLQELHRTTMPVRFESDTDVFEVGYGLGWFTQFYRGEPLLTHGGNHWGVSTDLALLPRLGLGVAVLANQDSSQYPTALLRTIIDRFMGVSRDWPAEMLKHHRTRLERKDNLPQKQAAERELNTKPSRPLSAYIGTYSHPAMGPVKVVLDGAHLMIEGSGEKSPLIHWHYDVFAAASTDHLGMWAPEGWKVRVTFITNTRGTISELRLSNASGYTFKRKPD